MSNNNLPLYYEKYPVINLARSNYANNMDLEYLNTLFPNEIAELKYIIEQECDKLDYNGSMIYDECPDKIMFMSEGIAAAYGTPEELFSGNGNERLSSFLNAFDK